MGRLRNILILVLLFSIIVISFLLIRVNRKLNELNSVAVEILLNSKPRASIAHNDSQDSLSYIVIKQIDSTLLYNISVSKEWKHKKELPEFSPLNIEKAIHDLNMYTY